MWALSSYRERGLRSNCGVWASYCVASLVAGHGLWVRRASVVVARWLSSCDAEA